MKIRWKTASCDHTFIFLNNLFMQLFMYANLWLKMTQKTTSKDCKKIYDEKFSFCLFLQQDIRFSKESPIKKRVLIYKVYNKVQKHIPSQHITDCYFLWRYPAVFSLPNSQSWRVLGEFAAVVSCTLFYFLLHTDVAVCCHHGFCFLDQFCGQRFIQY